MQVLLAQVLLRIIHTYNSTDCYCGDCWSDAYAEWRCYNISSISAHSATFSIIRDVVEMSSKAVKGDKSIIREISEIERYTDMLDTDINFACTTFIALFQPVARDLRFALSMIRISSSYERIVDLAQEIALYECKMPVNIL